MAPVSLPRVLNEINLVKQEVQSNKQILITILSTLNTFKDESLKSYSSLTTKIEEVDNKVNIVTNAVKEIIGPSEVVDYSENCDNDIYDATTKNLPNRSSTEVTPSVQLSTNYDMIKVEEVKDDPLDDNSSRKEWNESLYNSDDSCSNILPSIKKKSSKRKSADPDYIPAAESHSSFIKRKPGATSGMQKKCRDGCPNCETPSCRKCTKCLQRRRCKFRECSEYQKTLKSRNNISIACPQCSKSFFNRMNLERHLTENRCSYDERYLAEYQDLQVKCVEVNCLTLDKIYPNYKAFAEHRSITGHKNWRYRCDVCFKWNNCRMMIRHMATHGKKSSGEPVLQVSADSIAHMSAEDFVEHEEDLLPDHMDLDGSFNISSGENKEKEEYT